MTTTYSPHQSQSHLPPSSLQSSLQSLRTQLQLSRMQEKRYLLQLSTLQSTRTKISTQLQQLSSNYTRQLKSLQQKVKKLENENKVLMKKNSLYQLEIQNFQNRIVEKDRIISKILMGKEFVGGTVVGGGKKEGLGAGVERKVDDKKHFQRSSEAIRVENDAEARRDNENDNVNDVACRQQQSFHEQRKNDSLIVQSQPKKFDNQPNFQQQQPFQFQGDQLNTPQQLQQSNTKPQEEFPVLATEQKQPEHKIEAQIREQLYEQTHFKHEDLSEKVQPTQELEQDHVDEEHRQIEGQHLTNMDRKDDQFVHKVSSQQVQIQNLEEQISEKVALQQTKFPQYKNPFQFSNPSSPTYHQESQQISSQIGDQIPIKSLQQSPINQANKNEGNDNQFLASDRLENVAFDLKQNQFDLGGSWGDDGLDNKEEKAIGFVAVNVEGQVQGKTADKGNDGIEIQEQVSPSFIEPIVVYPQFKPSMVQKPKPVKKSLPPPAKITKTPLKPPSSQIPPKPTKRPIKIHRYKQQTIFDQPRIEEQQLQSIQIQPEIIPIEPITNEKTEHQNNGDVLSGFLENVDSQFADDQIGQKIEQNPIILSNQPQERAQTTQQTTKSRSQEEPQAQDLTQSQQNQQLHNKSQSSLNKSKKGKRNQSRPVNHAIINFEQDVVYTPQQNEQVIATTQQNTEDFFSKLANSQTFQQNLQYQPQYNQPQYQDDHQMHGLVDQSSIQQIQDTSMISGPMFPEDNEFAGEKINYTGPKRRGSIGQGKSTESMIGSETLSKKMSKKKAKREMVQMIDPSSFV